MAARKKGKDGRYQTGFGMDQRHNISPTLSALLLGGCATKPATPCKSSKGEPFAKSQLLLLGLVFRGFRLPSCFPGASRAGSAAAAGTVAGRGHVEHFEPTVGWFGASIWTDEGAKHQ